MKEEISKPTEASKEVTKVMGAPKEMAKEMAEKLTEEKPKFDLSGMKNPDGSEPSEEIKKELEDVAEIVNSSDDPLDSDEFIEKLKKIQSESGDENSKEVLDRIIAMREAKKNGTLEEFFAAQEKEKAERQAKAHEKYGMTKEQRKLVHDFMHTTIGCDEYIVIAMKEQKEGLQMEVLTQLKGEMVQSILESIIESIEKRTGIQGSETLD